MDSELGDTLDVNDMNRTVMEKDKNSEDWQAEKADKQHSGNRSNNSDQSRSGGNNEDNLTTGGAPS